MNKKYYLIYKKADEFEKSAALFIPILYLAGAAGATAAIGGAFNKIRDVFESRKDLAQLCHRAILILTEISSVDNFQQHRADISALIESLKKISNLFIGKPKDEIVQNFSGDSEKGLEEAKAAISDFILKKRKVCEKLKNDSSFKDTLKSMVSGLTGGLWRSDLGELMEILDILEEDANRIYAGILLILDQKTKNTKPNDQQSGQAGNQSAGQAQKQKSQKNYTGKLSKEMNDVEAKTQQLITSVNQSFNELQYSSNPELLFKKSKKPASLVNYWKNTFKLKKGRNLYDFVSTQLSSIRGQYDLFTKNEISENTMKSSIENYKLNVIDRGNKAIAAYENYKK